MGAMHFLNETGHSTLTWDPDQLESVQLAEQEFSALTSWGYVAFKKESPEREPERIKTFDPEAEEILWLRPLQGG